MTPVCQTRSIYLAGASAEVALCERYRDRLQEAGFTITHDWMRDVRAHEAAGLGEWELPINVRRASAMGCLAGVDQASLVWVLLPKGQSIGAWVELGYALRLATSAPAPDFKVVVSGGWRSIFGDLAIHYTHHEIAFAAIIGGLVSTPGAAVAGFPGGILW